MDILLPRDLTMAREALSNRHRLNNDLYRPSQAWQWMNQTRTLPEQQDWVRSEVQQAWRRCREEYQLPLGHFSEWQYCGMKPPTVSQSNESNEILKIIQQIEENFLPFMVESGLMMVITSDSGDLLHLLGDLESYAYFLKRMNDHHINWHEAAIGNNGPGSAVVLRKPIAFQGMEHYLSLLHPYTTVGYPIIEDNGKLLAVIGLIGDCRQNMNALFAFLHLICVLINGNFPIAADPDAQQRILQQIGLYRTKRRESNIDFNHEADTLKPMIKKAVKLQRYHIPILVTGESGVGKDYFVNLIKQAGPRKNGPLIAINCASIPHELIESELFGYEAGSFTGARNSGKPGKFRLADRGTLFLDEIGDMSFELQSTLLRVLETSEFTPVGGTRSVRVDVQVVAATNVNLLEAVEAGRFRRDLYYRLNGAQIHLPPLRERSDKVPLIHRVMKQELDKLPVEERVEFSSDVIALFEQHSWPGNVRQLLNVLRSTLYTAQSSLITQDDLPDDFKAELNNKDNSAVGTRINNRQFIPSQSMSLADWEAYGIKTALLECEGNISLAAKKLGITRSTLYKKIERFGLDRSGAQPSFHFQ
ncbi:sigma-54-dependent Fis family transcriptional regulator [Methylotuvimicrobium buryatense]|nr:sigma 54-interacting transcriptional regulator [Methylotuvimicrobium buryatense]